LVIAGYRIKQSCKKREHDNQKSKNICEGSVQPFTIGLPTLKFEIKTDANSKEEVGFVEESKPIVEEHQTTCFQLKMAVILFAKSDYQWGCGVSQRHYENCPT